MFRIGDFARLAQISTRALRLYDRLGLLKPAAVDSFTEYRYYTIDQLPRLNRIIALKDLGFSLEQIGRTLNRTLPATELRGMLRLKQAELEQHARETLERLSRVETRLKQIELEDVMPDYEIVLKKIQAAVEDPNCHACQGLKWIQAGEKPPGADVFMRRIEATDAIPLGVTPDTVGAKPNTGPIFFVRGGTTPSEGLPPLPPEPIDLDPDTLVTMPFVEAHALPGVESAATTVHAGGRETIMLACRALVDWINANGYRVAGHYQELGLKPGEMYECVIPVMR
jgi:DNA-binding transcriptional MerR regulator